MLYFEKRIVRKPLVLVTVKWSKNIYNIFIFLFLLQCGAQLGAIGLIVLKLTLSYRLTSQTCIEPLLVYKYVFPINSIDGTCGL